MYTLILTIAYYTGNSIEHVPGFNSKVLCETAAREWKENVAASSYLSAYKQKDIVMSTICVKTS